MPEPVALRSIVGSAFFGRFKDMNTLQRAAVAPILDGQDVLLRASTASGKTEAAMAPLVERHLEQLMTGDVTIIVISPTKALVNDLARRLEPPLDTLGVRVGVRHGDRNQLKTARPPEVLITTPESFDIMVGQRPESLRRVAAVLLDEIHLLYNTQRGMQVAIAVHRFELWLNRPVQVVGLSATIGAASDVWTFFRPGRSVKDINIAAGRGISYQIRLDVSPDDLVGMVRRVADKGKVLVFTNSRHECDLIADRLRESRVVGDRVYAHHSSLDRHEREYVEASFADTDTAVCVATSTLELGIDIGSIDLVVLYGAPSDWASLAQRVGRGNRRSATVEALFCVPTRAGQPTDIVDRLSFQALMSEWNNVGDTWGPQEVYGAASQQLCAHVLSTGGFVEADELHGLLEPWPHLGRRTTQQILEGLVEHDILQRHPAHHRYGASDGLHDLEESRDIWSNLVGGGFQVPVLLGERRVGSISARNLGQLTPGAVFLLGGRRFRVSSADVYAIRVQSATSASTMKLEVDSARAEPGLLRAEWFRRVLLAEDAVGCVRPQTVEDALAREVSRLKPLASDAVLPVAVQGGWKYLTFAGSILNALIAEWAGGGAATEFFVTTPTELDWSRLPALDELSARHVAPTTAHTVWQENLPETVRDAEHRSWIRSNRTAELVLHRLRRAKVTVVDPDLFQRFR